MSKVEEAITEHWGRRCPDYAKDCPCCQAWAEYDGRKAATVWDPIRSAPKDGHTILMWSPDAYGDGIMFGFWGKTKIEPKGFWVALNSAGEPINIDAEPTHWLALPEPPNA